MPIYEYRCQVCLSEFEQFVRSMSASFEVRCPSCGALDVKKVWSVFGVGAGGEYGTYSSDAASACAPTGT
jgi:putative FmdB family regulatory protein